MECYSLMPDAGLKLAAARLQLPLTVPYRLAFGEQRQFDVLLVAAIGDQGVGWGEATILPGYTDETIEGSWAVATELTERSRTVHELRTNAAAYLHRAPFTATAFLTAIDWLQGHSSLKRSGRFELLGTVNGKCEDIAKLENEIETLLAQGYKTLKVKIGWEPDADLKQVNAVRRIVGGRAKMRIDGNQGYTREQAQYFLRKLDPSGVELVEQPCAADDWDSAVALIGAGDAPLMLDESIYTLDDIDKAANLKCADYIKLKLMKLGTLDTLERGLRQIADRGMKAVLGNGVATDLGCWMEMCVGLSCVSTAGEMNGFLKTPIQLLKPPLKRDGAIVTLDGVLPTIDLDAVARSATQRVGAWNELS
jgi:L-alanine-DL-glutamate epimerase-like enolase superfamily enzyme